MATVEVYSTPLCPHCEQAKLLLERRNIRYVVIDASEPEARATMMDRAGGARSVPQVFIAGHHVGGFAELAALDRRGELEPLLRAG